MELYKTLTIAWKELYVRFTDRNLLLIMLASPLAISTIIGLAFGGLGSDDVPIRDIPILLVNHDQREAFGVNFGQVYVSLLIPAEGGTDPGLPACQPQPAPQAEAWAQPAGALTLQNLTEAQLLDEGLARQLIADGTLEAPQVPPESPAYLDEVAKAAVDAGLYTAAVLIPADFSQAFADLAAPAGASHPVDLTVYANRGRPISAGIARSIVEGITNQLMTGTIAISATFAEMAAATGPQAFGQASAGLDLAAAFACAFTPAANTVRLDRQTIQPAKEERGIASIILVAVGSSQAMFFALFTAQIGVFSMYAERRQWTLQRLIMSPTTPGSILGGKLVGVFGGVLFQLLLLLVALTLVGSILERRLVLIWGSNLPVIALVLLSISLSVSGLGMLLAGVARSPEQGQIFGSVINMAMAVLGGAFGFTLPRQISMFSMLYWGQDAFNHLAAGQTDIWLNVLILTGQGLVMYLLGLVLFQRRFEM